MVRVNFAEVAEFDKLAQGRYIFTVTDGEVKQTGEDSKHPEEDYWRLELTVQEGNKAGTKEWVNIFLPPYEPKVLKTILRCTVGQHEWTDEDLDTGDFDVELDDVMNLTFSAAVSPQKGNSDFNNVGSFKKVEDTEGDESLLP